jgi:hypothetical protein
MKMALEIWNRIIFNLHRATFNKKIELTGTKNVDRSLDFVVSGSSLPSSSSKSLEQKNV